MCVCMCLFTTQPAFLAGRGPVLRERGLVGFFWCCTVCSVVIDLAIEGCERLPDRKKVG